MDMAYARYEGTKLEWRSKIQSTCGDVHKMNNCGWRLALQCIDPWINGDKCDKSIDRQRTCMCVNMFMCGGV